MAEAPKRSRRVLRWLLGIGVTLVVIVVVLAGLVLATLSSETGTRWLVARAVQSLDGALTIDNPTGSLLGGVGFDRLVWKSAEQTVTVDRLSAQWSVRPLRTIHVDTLKIARIEVRSSGVDNGEPPSLPATLAIPVDLTVDSLAIDRIELASPTRTTVIEAVSGRLETGLTHHVQLASASVEGVTLSGQASLGALRPYALTAALTARSDSWPQFDSIAADASGSLETLDVKARVTWPEAARARPADVVATLEPFAPWPVRKLSVDAPQVPLSTLLPSAVPDAALALKATLEDNGRSGLAGPIEIVNSKPGPLDADRVPVSRLAARADFDANSIAFDGLQIRLTRDGRSDDGSVGGRLRVFFDGRVEADLEVAKVDPQAFAKAALATKIDGHVKASTERGATRAEVDLRGQGLVLTGHASLVDRLVTVEQAVLHLGNTPGAGELELHGTLGLDAPRKFEAQLQARRFEPALFMTKVAPSVGGLHELRWTDTRLEGRIDAKGALPSPRGDFEVALEFAINGSRFANMQIDANGKSGIAQRAGRLLLVDSDASLQFDENRLVWRGGFGASDQALTMALKAPRLDRLRALAGVPLRGEFDLNATLSGDAANPVVGSSFEVRNLAIASSLGIKNASGTATVANQRIEVDASAGPLRAGSTPLTQATVHASGTLGEHLIQLGVDSAATGAALHARAELAGGWIDGTPAGGRRAAVAARWVGSLRSLTNSGRIDVALQAPAPLELSGDLQRFGPARVSVGGGSIGIDKVEHRGDHLQASGQVQSFPARALALWLPRLDLAQNTLTVGGSWRVDIDDDVDAHVDLQRERGDLVLGADGTGPLGLERLGATLDVVANQVKGSFGVTAKRLGQLDGKLDTALTKREGSFGIVGDTPFGYTVKGELASLAWLALLVDTPVSADGRIRVDLTRSGTLAAAHLKGEVVGSALVLKSFDPRAELRDGHFRIDIDEDRLVLNDFAFSGRSGGALTGSGQLSLTNESGTSATTGPRPPAADGALEFTLDKLDALTDPSYHVIASGNIKLGFSREAVDISGAITADRARITVGNSLAPTLGSDVVITRGAVDDDTVVPPGTTALPVSVDVKFNFGRDFEVTGFGGDASLRGELALQARRGSALRTVGTISVNRGRYYAYGQQLEVNRGTVTFNGPLDNATIFFRATRPHLPNDIDVGLEISGTIREPRVKLVSNPEMSETEKLSWLALGRGIDSASGTDLQLIGIAASALFGNQNSTPLGSRLGSGIGLDQLDVRSDATTQETIVSVGKRLSDRLLLTFERSLSGTSTVAKLRYEVGRSWSVQTTTGTEQAIDVFYTFSFN
ncbi:translocation/assembly module TamB domain-containing protein [soil metagenome]